MYNTQIDLAFRYCLGMHIPTCAFLRLLGAMQLPSQSQTLQLPSLPIAMCPFYTWIGWGSGSQKTLSNSTSVKVLYIVSPIRTHSLRFTSWNSVCSFTNDCFPTSKIAYLIRNESHTSKEHYILLQVRGNMKCNLCLMIGSVIQAQVL